MSAQERLDASGSPWLSPFRFAFVLVVVGFALVDALHN
jgi:hypothetical protein